MIAEKELDSVEVIVDDGIEAKKKRLAELQEKVKVLAEERHRKIEQRVEQFAKFKKETTEKVSEAMKAYTPTQEAK